MQGMMKTIPELFVMLKSMKVEIKKEHQVLMVNKTTSFKKKGKGKKKVSGKLIHEHLWGPSPFRFGRGRRPHEEWIEAVHTSSLPSFGALRRDKTPTAAWLYWVFLLGSEMSYRTERGSVLASNESNPFYVAHGPPFIRSRGHQQVET